MHSDSDASLLPQRTTENSELLLSISAVSAHLLIHCHCGLSVLPLVG